MKNGTPPTERELEALKILWDRGESTVREIWEAMNAAGEDSPYTTVLSLLQVMTKKDLVTHRRQGKAHVYRPRLERDDAFRSLASGFLNRVFDGAVHDYLAHALDAKRLETSELDELEGMIAAARKRHDETDKEGTKK